MGLKNRSFQQVIHKKCRKVCNLMILYYKFKRDQLEEGNN
jgi:hypothetical protein